MAEIDFKAMNDGVVEEFRRRGGKVAAFGDSPSLILVHHTGAKSGTERIAPLVFLDDGGRLFIFASKGGDPKHPDWYHNLKANPNTKVEVGTETFPVTVKELTGAERDEIFTKQKAVAPQFAEYESKTDRLIPVLELVRS
jgi:deazaflavin-dependent oxidoreductase (nitroreductase family)